MEKISVKVYHNSGMSYYTLHNQAALKFTTSDCDYIWENNLSSVWIEATIQCSKCRVFNPLHCLKPIEGIECGDYHFLVPLIKEEYVSVIREQQRGITIITNEVKDEEELEDADFKNWLISNCQKVDDGEWFCNGTDYTEDMLREIYNKKTKQELEAGKVMSATEWIQKEYKGLVLFASPHVVDAYADYRVKAENLFTEQDIGDIINSYLYFLMEDSKSGEHEPETGKEWLTIFLTEYKKQK